MPFNTYVGFDVNPNGKDWVFRFAPQPGILEKAVCQVAIPLAKSKK